MAYPQPQIDQFRYSSIQAKPEDKKEESFEAKLLRTVAEYYDLTKETRPRRYYLWLLADLFAKGIHYFDYDPYKGSLEEWSARKVSQCMYVPTPLLQYAVEVIAAQYTTSNGRPVPMPTDQSDPKVKAVVRGLQEYADYLDWKFYRSDPSQRQTEAKLIPLRGVYNFLEHDKSAGPKIQVPQYEAVEQSVCSDCGYEVGGEDANRMVDPASLGDVSVSSLNPDVQTQGSQLACPECGSTNIKPLTLGVQNKGMLSGRQGEVVRHVVDSYQVEIYDRGRGIEQSKHLIYDDILFKTEAKRRYPWLKDVNGQAMLGNYERGFLGLHFLNQLQVLIGNTGKLDQANPSYIDQMGPSAYTLSYGGSYLSPLLCWRRRVWFDHEVYADWPIEKDTPLPGRNDLIPAGGTWGDVFPAGLLIHIMNGDTVVQLENQDKNHVWSYVSYRVPSAGLHGTGVGSLVSLNRGYDEANSFGMQALLMAALGIIVADERVPRAENIPGRTITIPQDARMPNESIQSLVGRLDMGGGAAIAAAEPIKESFRGAIGDMSMAANPQGFGLRPQGVGKETATAARYNAGATGTLVSPPMELYAAHRAKVVEQAIELERLHSVRPRLYGKCGDTTAKWFDPMDIPEDIRFGVAEDSWRPRTIETEREDIGAAISLGVGTGAIQNPALEQKALQVFGLDDDIGDSSDWEILAEKRLDALKAAAPQFEGVIQQVSMQVEQMMMQAQIQASSGTPEGMLAAQVLQQQAQQAEAQLPLKLIEIAQAAPQPMDMAGHPYFISFYEDVYKSDEYDSFPPVLQQAIQRLWAMHQQGIGQAGAIATEQQVMATAPATQAQQEQAAAQNAQTQQSEQAGQSQQEVSAEDEHSRSMELQDRTHEHAKELEELKARHAAELEKVRAKNKPKDKK
jgi:hypothetical protein